MKLAVCLVAVVTLLGCELTEPGTNETFGALRSGDSFGFCIGYCIRSATIDGEWVQLEATGRDLDGPLPVRQIGVPLGRGQAANIGSLVEQIEFDRLDDVYGCPDCADGGAEWIEIDAATGTHRVLFEYGTPPAELQALSDTLRGIRVSLFEQMDLSLE